MFLYVYLSIHLPIHVFIYVRETEIKVFFPYPSNA